MLGTIITEGPSGPRDCARLFGAEAAKVADRLAAVAAYYGFDGYLVNIENDLPVAATSTGTSGVRHFLKLLKAALGRYIPRGREPAVVWYDAVTTEGKLQWQNGVTAKNKPFLEDCDGILCNYGWTPASLPVSKLVAGAHRCGDVYLGIDVHGRGTYGGGGWGCGGGQD